MVGYFRRSIPEFARKAVPLAELTKKAVTFTWGEQQHHELHTEDASIEGLAGLLLQCGEGKLMHLVYCVSKRTNEVKKKYHSSRLELMAI